jgi:hypothetical protein
LNKYDDDPEMENIIKFMPKQNSSRDLNSLLNEIADWHEDTLSFSRKYGYPDDDMRFEHFFDIRNVAEQWAREREYSFAVQIANIIRNESHRSDCLEEIAKIQINNNDFTDALETLNLIIYKRGKSLKEIANKFLSIGNTDFIKKLVIPLSNTYDGAYHVCRLLVDIYPEYLDDIAIEVLRINDQGHGMTFSSKD